MSRNAHIAFRNHMESLSHLRLEIENAKSHEEFSRRWSSVLEYVKLATAALVKLGVDCGGDAKAIASRYKELQRTDPILQYLKLARDAHAHEDERGFSQVSKEFGPFFSVGGRGMLVRPGSRIKMSGNIVNGMPFDGEFGFDQDAGPWARWDFSGVPVVYEPLGFELEAVCDKKGRVFLSPERNGAILTPLACLDHATSSLARFETDLLESLRGQNYEEQQA